MSKKPKLNKSRVFLAFAAVVCSIVFADEMRRSFFPMENFSIVVDGDFKNSSDSSSNGGDSATLVDDTQSTSQSTTNLHYLGYSEFAIPSSQLNSGLLTVVDSTHPTAVSSALLVKLAEVKNEMYSLRSDDLVLDSETADALNSMMSDYNAATGLSNFVVYSTTQAYTGEDSVYPAPFAESALGYSIDLAINGAYKVIEYDGMDTEEWVVRNCTKYGFVVRYPQGKEIVTGQTSCVYHLRYVGNIHAAVLSQYNLCLDEYSNWLKTHTIDNPLEVQVEGVPYTLYYVPYMGETSPARVPVSGNYTISGNNIDGFIISALKTN